VEGFWAIFFLLVVLKIPVIGALWLVWWAVRAEPLPEDGAEDDGGYRFPRRGPSKPRGPRRGGPHGTGARPLPQCPPAGRRHVILPPAPERALARASRELPDAPYAPHR
jgi:hypothetical protein